MWKSIDIICDTCELVRVQLVDVPSGTPLPNTVICDLCGMEATRKISCHIAKGEIEDRTHGGRRIGNQLVSQHTGGKEQREQWLLEKGAKKAAKAGRKEEAAEMQAELSRKKEEVLKKL